ncbi:bifunctional tRNA (5-methylaminomethyl-2-thiouridine)(34)-methyltransferase MnmD/FAD-dependent 5-carboxymethylaminomethyl-2-thiouridine(34) oxidoreductase MnmC [Gilvimarinus sp. DA14]|uniref:bifunctional tRNA (5-methylaminomethyl-2-thiouridine)(34)-methyltransferase MnmD/FAD-dependent 5-carboxymethylaminomethyl-2-thiouridine(34) oxidoreductase MnmC n=1 Tax=Gilvimarinus sp. DA14 TaxID=2956798 RepID=UPI0020B67614|nr:bifunctional tRNA (5-methylaminomethyl-2-thiouridine)(34)-methyltransferase MnmD/FAD-dependent 5-carboxymethylaminomethyl-2-thiouridine(34) oxidoreductase MnmC [Gilvimarinus sp. DA14]UTF61407.1 bifunctional tRNA (5-methylaminomethyl-2-thiouridine)(34)-methyltransferase MnmD/FAD-dependent 5-carboxymethylaminomethyl-2-thiouridine(34) oxidoreductase MnmC [Gilvimarinus sp. DA14]
MKQSSHDSAKLTWDEQGQPLSSAFGDVYFSRHDGLAETRHVFLKHNQLAERFCQLKAVASGPHPVFTIAETGFGTGLNFLAAWQLWQQQAPLSAKLHFVSCEKFPLGKADLVRALGLWPELTPLAKQLIEAYPDYLPPGVHRLKFAGVSLSLIIADAAEGFAQLLPSGDSRWQTPNFNVDAWFLDGFAPSKNPDMWSDELFQTIGVLSAKGTTAATFSAAGVVKRGLTTAGFRIQKVPGFGRKREMVCALHAGVAAPTEQAPSAYHEPGVYHRITHSASARTAIVVGAGLAGCHTARALAERGWQVQVLDSEPAPAQQGSGNRQGVLYAKLSHRNETLPNFNLHALLYAQRHYQGYWQADQIFGDACGVIQLACDEKQQRQYRQISEQHPFAAWLDARAASARAGVELPTGGLYFSACGWLNPPAVCRALLEHPLIAFTGNCEVTAIERADAQWRTLNAQANCSASADILILAGAHQCRNFSQLMHLPLKAIRGQVSHLPASPASEKLQTVLCAKGYIAPASQRQHSLGATFNLGQTDTQLRSEDHDKNIEHLGDFGAELQHSLTPIGHEQLDGRAALRCTTPDYLPIVGPAPDAAALERDFAPLSKNAKARLNAEASYYPGLYLNTGFGSRGLAYTPLCAEFLAALINAEPPPLPRQLSQALHPARFILRDLIRR